MKNKGNDIWRMKMGRIVAIVNLSDFKGAADAVLPEHFADTENLKRVFDCFFEKAGATADGEELRCALEETMTYATMEDASAWLENIAKYVKKVRKYRYLDYPIKAYIDSAKAVIQEELPGAPESGRSEAFVYLALASCVFAQKAEEMKPVTRSRLLSFWQGSARTVLISGGERFLLSLDLAGEQPLMRRMLVNESGVCVSFTIIDWQGAGHEICMPPHTRRLALFAGDTMTCIKGSIAESGGYARALVGGQMLYLLAKEGGTVRLSKADEALTDYAGDLRLNGTKLLAGGETASGVLAAFKADSQYAYLMEGGALISSDARLDGKNALCVLQEENHLHAVLRGGEAVSTAAQPPCAQEILSRMLARFDAGAYAERVNAAGGAFVMTRGGELRFIGND